MCWNSDGERCWIEYEPDPRHAELIVKSLNLESAKGVTTPSVKKSQEEVLATFAQLDEGGVFVTRQTRSVVVNKRAGERHAETDRTIDDQSEAPWTLFEETSSTANVVRLEVYGDSDHAGCLKTRRSTTGMVLMRSAHCLKVSSHTQPAISLSSGESECYGIVKRAAIGSRARSMRADFGMCADVVVRTASSIGLAVGSRRRLGRLRHVQTRYLCVQQRQEGDLFLKKEPGNTNVNDTPTKPLYERRMTNLLTAIGCEFRDGRTSLALEAH